MANDDSIKRTYGEWLALSKPDRVRLGLPTSQAKWAEAFGIDAKTATRWKEDPVVVATLNRARARENQDPDPNPDDLPTTTADGLAKLRQDLLAKALKGDERSVEQFMKWFGKDDLEAERRAVQAGIQAKSDEELVVEILDMIGPEAVEAWLEGKRVAVGV